MHRKYLAHGMRANGFGNAAAVELSRKPPPPRSFTQYARPEYRRETAKSGVIPRAITGDGNRSQFFLLGEIDLISANLFPSQDIREIRRHVNNGRSMSGQPSETTKIIDRFR